MSEKHDFKDVLIARRELFGCFTYATQRVNPKKTMEINKHCTPQDVKNIVLNSDYLDSIIEAESIKSGISKEKLKQQVKEYLDEIGLGENTYSIRFLGYVYLKGLTSMNMAIFLNERQLLKIKESMGNTPMLFLPAHRSYVDCILLSYLFFGYNIKLPVSAAAIDLSRMFLLGTGLRHANTFFIRRTLAGAPLYEATLRQYVRTLVTSFNAPIQIFLEGTRSRSNKSMAPKYGILSMSLIPLFSKEVSDIVMVPMYIGYDRLMEELRFVYEHLGVPKPKESTTDIMKVFLSGVEHFGNLYVNVGKPFSLNDYIKKEFKSKDPLPTNKLLKPTLDQELTAEQRRQVQIVGDHVLALQQKYMITSISNLLALVLMGSVIKNKPLSLEEVIEEVRWTKDIVKSLGAFVLLEDVVPEVERLLVVHSKMMTIDNNKKFRLLASSKMTASEEVKSKMKGHVLRDETIVNALPIMRLQLYVNTVLHFLIPPALVQALVIRGVATKEQLATDWLHIRKMLKYVFFYDERDEIETFKNALQWCIQNKVIVESNGSYSPTAEERLQYLLKWTIWPALTTLLKCTDVMTELQDCEHKKALKAIQERVERNECHPYSLSIDVAAKCLQGLVLVGALHSKKGNETVYELVPSVMDKCRQLINALLPTFSVDFGRNNTVIVDQEFLETL